MKKSIKYIICLLSLITFLTVSTVGKVERVNAAASAAAIAGAAALGAGAIFIAYLAFTGARAEIPLGADQNEYLTRVGNQFAQYPSGSKIYNDIKSFLLTAGTGALALPQYVFNWTTDKALDIYNDFKDTSILQDIFGWDKALPTDSPLNGYDYGHFSNVPQTYQGGDIPETWSFEWNSGPRIALSQYQNTMYACNTEYVNGRIYRNLHTTGDRYYAQFSTDGGATWYNLTGNAYISMPVYVNNALWMFIYPVVTYYNGSDYIATYTSSRSQQTIAWAQNTPYPVLIDSPIYDDVVGEYEETETEEGETIHVIPQWYDIVSSTPTDYPIVPYVQLPSNNPNNYDPDENNHPWGIPLGNLLDTLENLGEGIIDASIIAQIIDAFKNSLSGDEYNEYNYYENEGDTYNYYYTNTYYQNEYNYNYNYNIKEQSEKLPVDLNSLRQVTDNRLFDEIKDGSDKFGDTISNYVAFWHNTDYTIVYVFLGGILWICLCAFIGKWGGH